MKIAGIVLALLFLCLSLFLCLYARSGLFHRIDAAQVKDIILWRNGPESGTVNLDGEKTAAFVQLYNGAKYGGEGDGSGGTAEWGAVIVLHGGDEIRILEFSGRPDFEVTFSSGKWFYLNSDGLKTCILEYLKEAKAHD